MIMHSSTTIHSSVTHSPRDAGYPCQVAYSSAVGDPGRSTRLSGLIAMN